MMKVKNDNRAFTLIELLAVIVILAVVALIATPNVLNIIEDSRKSAAEENARVIASTAENYYAQHTLLQKERVGEIDLTGDTLNYNGDKPYKGYVYFDDQGNAYIKLYQNGYCVVRDYDNKTEATKMEAKECEIKSLLIFVDLDGGKLDDTRLEFEQGDTYGELPTPTKDGYTFLGWYDKDGNPITKDTIIDKSSTIYAKWEANTYTVTLSLPDGVIPETNGWELINEVPTKVITYDTVYGILPEPSKTGYTFDGWYTYGGFKITSESILIISKDHTLIGNFIPNEYEITYIPNNGENHTIQTIKYDSNYNLPNVTKTGYKFLGWYDGNIKIEDNSVVKILENKTYEAKWEANKYNVTFKYNDGVTNNTTKEVIYDNLYGTLPSINRVGYTFLGWYDNTKLVMSDTQVKILDNQTLEAKWEANKYDVTFVYGNGTANTTTSVTYDSTYGELPNPSKTGYTFNGWYDGSTKVESTSIVKITANQTLTASWQANTYTVTYVYNNGTANTTETVTYDGSYTLPNPTKTGYVFQGWFTTGGATITSSSKVTIAENHTLTALWSASGYTLTYNANGGSVSPGTAPITYDSTYGTLPTPSRTGYTFKGWYTSASGGTEVTASTVVKTAGNHSIYARWQANTYTVTFNYNGSGAANTTATVAYDGYYTLPSPSRTNYKFLGWYTAASGGTQVTSTTKVQITSNQTLYAHWELSVYITSLTLNTGSVTKRFKVNSTFNYTNLGVTANYSDGTTKTISSGYTVTTPSMTSGGSKSVTVSYSGVSASYSVEIGYYWNRYNANKTYSYTKSLGSSTRIYPPNYDIYGYGFYDEFSSSTGKFTQYGCGMGESWNEKTTCGSQSCENADGSTVGKGGSLWSTYQDIEWYVNSDYTDMYIVLDECQAGPGSDVYLVDYARSSYFVGYPVTISKTVSSVTRGSYIDQVFSTSSSAYPSNSYSGSYWYVSA